MFARHWRVIFLLRARNDVQQDISERQRERRKRTEYVQSLHNVNQPDYANTDYHFAQHKEVFVNVSCSTVRLTEYSSIVVHYCVLMIIFINTTWCRDRHLSLHDGSAYLLARPLPLSLAVRNPSPTCAVYCLASLAPRILSLTFTSAFYFFLNSSLAFF